MSIPTILAVLSKGTEAITRLSAWNNRTQGKGALLVEELRDNLVHLDMVAKGETQLANVIDLLSDTQYKMLLGEKFFFNSLKNQKIADYPSLYGTDLASWTNKTTEELIKSIYRKISDLRLRYKNAGESAKYQWGRRVQSIRKRVWLLLKHIEA